MRKKNLNDRIYHYVTRFIRRCVPVAAVSMALAAAVCLYMYLHPPQENGHDCLVPLPCEIVRVVDGDTIVVRMSGEEFTVRLIGVDAPESVHPDESRNTPEGTEASEYMSDLLPSGSKVYIEFGKDPKDKYGRTLAYVYLEDRTMVNELLIVSGHAVPMPIEPNTKYAERFEKLVRERDQENPNGY